VDFDPSCRLKYATFHKKLSFSSPTTCKMDESQKKPEEPDKSEVENGPDVDQLPIPELQDLSLFEPPPLIRHNALRGDALWDAVKKDKSK